MASYFGYTVAVTDLNGDGSVYLKTYCAVILKDKSLVDVCLMQNVQIVSVHVSFFKRNLLD